MWCAVLTTRNHFSSIVHFTLKTFFSTQRYKWVNATIMVNLMFFFMKRKLSYSYIDPRNHCVFTVHLTRKYENWIPIQKRYLYKKTLSFHSSTTVQESLSMLIRKKHWMATITFQTRLECSLFKFFSGRSNLFPATWISVIVL